MSEHKAPHVVLGVTGAIAAYKAADIVRGLRKGGAEVTVTLTAEARNFVTPFLLGTFSGHPPILDQYPPGGVDVRHVELSLRTSLLLVAPATAHTIARMSLGLADDFLTTFYLATAAPVLVAPAMNERMWEHPATREHVARLRSRGVHFVGPVTGDLASLHEGLGRMADPAVVVEEALRLARGQGSLDGEVVLVTAGPTAEDLDLARTLTNRSTGKMGFALAAEARARGAEVVLVTGPTEVGPPAGAEVVRVRSAEQMRDAVRAALPRATVVLMAAAVADYRPASYEPRKVKKGEGGLTLELVRTPDILAELGRDKGSRLLVGFAAEDRDLEARALDKLRAKGLDLIVANDISQAGQGFAADENQVILLGADGYREEVSKRGKREIASRILDRVEGLLGGRRR